MKHLMIYVALTGLILSLAGCRLNDMEPEEMQAFLDGVVENIGESQISDDNNLIGTRILANSSDSYHVADYKGQPHTYVEADEKLFLTRK